MKDTRTENNANQKTSTLNYPVLKRLPNGVHLVKQNGYSKGGIKKYVSFLKNGKIILIGAGDSIRDAKGNTLIELNKQLRDVALLWGDLVTQQNFDSVYK